jgi:hypothetical protein
MKGEGEWRGRLEEGDMSLNKRLEEDGHEWIG